MPGIFRKAAMDKLSSPEQLDQRIVVISPLRWLLLLGGVLIAAAVLIWAVCGQLTVTAGATGIYLSGPQAQAAAGDDDTVLLYCPLTLGKTVEAGMTVLVYPTSVDSSRTGHLTATVSAVEDYVTDTDKMLEQLGDSTLVQAFSAAGPVVAVICQLQTDADSSSGLAWSNRNGNSVELLSGTPVSAQIVTDTVRPVSFILPLPDEVTP